MTNLSINFFKERERERVHLKKNMNLQVNELLFEALNVNGFNFSGVVSNTEIYTSL